MLPQLGEYAIWCTRNGHSFLVAETVCNSNAHDATWKIDVVLSLLNDPRIRNQLNFTHVAVQFCPHNRTYVACHMRNTVAVLASGPRLSSLTKATLQHHQRADIREVKHDVTCTANGKHETFVVCLQLCTVE